MLSRSVLSYTSYTTTILVVQFVTAVAVLVGGLKTEKLHGAGSVSEVDILVLLATCVPLLRYDHADAVWTAIAEGLASSAVIMSVMYAYTFMAGQGSRYCLVGCIQRLVQALTVPMGDEVAEWWGPEMKGRLISFDEVAQLDEEIKGLAYKIYDSDLADDDSEYRVLQTLRERIWSTFVIDRSLQVDIVRPLAMRALVHVREAMAFMNA